jgi:hypothetical protein
MRQLPDAFRVNQIRKSYTQAATATVRSGPSVKSYAPSLPISLSPHSKLTPFFFEKIVLILKNTESDLSFEEKVRLRVCLVNLPIKFF